MKSLNKGGRPSFTPTAKQRYDVEILSGAGLKQDVIALIIGQSESTIKRKFKDELATGAARLQGACVMTIAGALAKGGSTGLRAADMLLTMRFGWSRFAPPPVHREPELGKKQILENNAQRGNEPEEWAKLLN